MEIIRLNKKSMANDKEYIFKVTIKGAPQIELWRRVVALGNQSLYELAEGIINAFDFDDFDHAFGFFSNVKTPYHYDSGEIYELFYDIDKENLDDPDEKVKSVKKTKISQAWKEESKQMLFLFDYGDDWQFLVRLEKIQKATDGKKKYPFVLESKGKAPEQY